MNHNRNVYIHPHKIANIQIGVPSFVERAKHEYGNLIFNGQEKGQENTIQYTTQSPVGVVVAIIPFNFPCDLFCQKVPSALIMGNAVILKPSGHNPLTLIKLVELLVEAGVDKGAVGKIDVYDKFSFVEVDKGVARKVMETLNNEEIKGTRVRVEIAKPRRK